MFSRLGRDFGFRAFITTILIVSFVAFIFAITFMYQNKEIPKDVIIMWGVFGNLVSWAAGFYFGNRSALDVQGTEQGGANKNLPP